MKDGTVRYRGVGSTKQRMVVNEAIEDGCREDIHRGLDLSKPKLEVRIKLLLVSGAPAPGRIHNRPGW